MSNSHCGKENNYRSYTNWGSPEAKKAVMAIISWSIVVIVADIAIPGEADSVDAK